MSNTELIVIGLGLCGGYWMVADFLRKKPPASANRERASAQKGSDHRGNSEKNAGSSWHEILNVSHEASVDEIRRAYRLQMSQYHPDKVAALGDELKALAESKSKEITGAYREAMRIRGVET